MAVYKIFAKSSENGVRGDIEYMFMYGLVICVYGYQVSLAKSSTFIKLSCDYKVSFFKRSNKEKKKISIFK